MPIDLIFKYKFKKKEAMLCNRLKVEKHTETNFKLQTDTQWNTF